MCLITKQKRVKILKEDLVVYKMIRSVGDRCFAWMRDFEYTLGFLHKQEMEVNNTPQTAMDEDVLHAYNILNSLEHSIHLTHVHIGFHFATSIERVYDYNEVIFECIVPKGSRVYFDKTGLGVTNQIKIVKKCSN